MFCPNCGTQNDEAASTCSKCGFNLKASAPKFKGTMLMVNSPVAGGAAPAPAPAPPAQDQAAINKALRGTVVGIAPPAAGGHAPPAPVPQPIHPRPPPFLLPAPAPAPVLQRPRPLTWVLKPRSTRLPVP
ncbi:MAG: zinc ribbon domain-containing protein [Polyangiaceae bacterium]